MIKITSEFKEACRYFSLIRPAVFRDGDQWCLLFGENTQMGVAGFGDTIHDAIIDFYRQFHIEA